MPTVGFGPSSFGGAKVSTFASSLSNSALNPHASILVGLIRLISSRIGRRNRSMAPPTTRGHSDLAINSTTSIRIPARQKQGGKQCYNPFILASPLERAPLRLAGRKFERTLRHQYYGYPERYDGSWPCRLCGARYDQFGNRTEY